MMHEFCSIFIQNIVKQGRSLTHTVSPDKIQHVRSECRPSKYWRKEKENISRKALNVWLVAVSKLGNAVFVQPGAKINSVYYSENVFEQGLLPTIRCRPISNNDFVFQQDAAPVYHSHHTVAYLCSNVPEFTEPENWPLNSPDLNPADYLVWGVAADGLSSQNFRLWSAKASYDRLMGSAKPGHTEPSDWSAAKKSDDGYQRKGWSCWISSGLLLLVCMSWTITGQPQNSVFIRRMQPR